MMRPTRVLPLIGIAAGLSLWSWTMTSMAKEAARAASSKNTATESDVNSKDLARIEEKLDQVLANQQTILQKFDEVMEELRIVKVRATMTRGGR